MELNEIRQSIDKIDDQISALYLQRMDLVNQVSQAKKQSGKPVFDPEREKKILYPTELGKIVNNLLVEHFHHKPDNLHRLLQLLVLHFCIQGNLGKLKTYRIFLVL